MGDYLSNYRNFSPCLEHVPLDVGVGVVNVLPIVHTL